MTSLTVSCLGDEAFKRQLRISAAQRGVSMAVMTRFALEQVYGKDFSTEVDFDSFFAKRVSQETHSNTESHTVTEARESA